MLSRYEIGWLSHDLDGQMILAESEDEALDLWAATQRYGWSNTYSDFADWCRAHRHTSDPDHLVISHGRARVYVLVSRAPREPMRPVDVTHEFVDGDRSPFPLPIRCYV